MWPFKPTPKIDVTPPADPPPSLMTAKAFSEAQQRYLAKYEKIVRPNLAEAWEAAKLASDYFKMAVTYLVLGNTGGLAALVVLAPLLHEGNRLWLSQQTTIAVLFAAGAFLGVAVAVVAYYNFLHHIRASQSRAGRLDSWIMRPEFNLTPQWQEQIQDWYVAVQRNAERHANASLVVSIIVFAASGLCWAVGAILLAAAVSAGSAIT